MFFALEFPSIGHLVDWEGLLFKDSLIEVNKTVMLMFLALAIVLALFIVAAKRGELVPRGVQNVVEAGVDFVRTDVIQQTIGQDGMRFLPFLVTMFFFIFVTNIFEVIPGIQFPVNARMALPAFLALLVWAMYNYIGIRTSGFFGYLKSITIPPGVPKALLVLVAPIEFISTIFVRPFSLAVRLFANMLAGHLLLVTFAVLSAAVFSKTLLIIMLPLTFGMLTALTGFEVLVAVLQAFIFTILTAVYIAGAMHPEH
ncbi:MAG: F0F1 ATP synthase subunit A [Acidimicrobiales bacterium]